MTHPVDRAAAIIAEEWATFSNRDLCGHEIGLARALHRDGMLNTTPAGGLGGASPDDVELALDFAAEFADSTHVPDRTVAAARVLQALIGHSGPGGGQTVGDGSPAGRG